MHDGNTCMFSRAEGLQGHRSKLGGTSANQDVFETLPLNRAF